MSEFKSGLYRTATGKTWAVVVCGRDAGHPFLSLDEGDKHAGHTTDNTLAKCTHLGPAVIGESGGSVIDELREMIAKANELRDQSISYRRSWDEAKDEVARLTEERDAAEAERLICEAQKDAVTNERDILAEKMDSTLATMNAMGEKLAEWSRDLDSAAAEITRLKHGEFTDDELKEIWRLGDDRWKKVMADKSVEYSVGEGGVERYGFGTVTVFRREGRELLCYQNIASNRDEWYVLGDTAYDSQPIEKSRTVVEAWCVARLAPKWRPAREDGSDNGKACRVRHPTDQDWTSSDDERNPVILVFIEPRAENKYVVFFDDVVAGWAFCEVQD